MLNFDRSTVKHGTQNIQNYCHQWLSGSFKVHQIRFRPGLCLGPHWGSLQRSRRPSSWFKGPILLSGGGEWEGQRERRRVEERKGRDGTPFRKFLDPPLAMCLVYTVWWSAYNYSMAQIPLGSTRLDTFDFVEPVEPVEQVETSVSSETSRAFPTWRTTNDLVQV